MGIDESLNQDHYTINFITDIGSICDPLNDNIDIEVVIGEKKYLGTLFTIRNIEKIMREYRNTGECAYGRYFWAVDLVIVERLDKSTIEAVVADLIFSGEIYKAFSSTSS